MQINFISGFLVKILIVYKFVILFGLRHILFLIVSFYLKRTFCCLLKDLIFRKIDNPLNLFIFFCVVDFNNLLSNIDNIQSSKNTFVIASLFAADNFVTLITFTTQGCDNKSRNTSGRA